MKIEAKLAETIDQVFKLSLVLHAVCPRCDEELVPFDAWDFDNGLKHVTKRDPFFATKIRFGHRKPKTECEMIPNIGHLLTS